MGRARCSSSVYILCAQVHAVSMLSKTGRSAYGASHVLARAWQYSSQTLAAINGVQSRIECNVRSLPLDLEAEG